MSVVPTIKPIVRAKFFDNVRDKLFHGFLSRKQVEGMNAILDNWEKHELKDKRWLAYMLATTYHETSFRMQPIEEYGKGENRDYGKKLKRGGGIGRRIPYTNPNEL